MARIMSKGGFVYIMTNKSHTTLYVGVTNDLCRRINEHKKHLIKNSFSDKYNLEYCIYYEEFSSIENAIQREKEIKKWNRQKKEDLIIKNNPKWEVLVTELGFVRDYVPIAIQVDLLLKELSEKGDIPPKISMINESIIGSSLPSIDKRYRINRSLRFAAR